MHKKFVQIILILTIAFYALSGCRTSKEKTPRNLFISEGSYSGSYWPTNSWRHCSPEQVGMNGNNLKLVYDYASNPVVNTEGIVIIKDGYIIAESYFGDFTQNSRHSSFSIAKSFMSALIGIALSEGLITGIMALVSDFFPEWSSGTVDPKKQRITLKHLLTMSSGLEWNESDYYNDTSNNDVFIMSEQNDYLQYVLNKQSEFEPGTIWRYSSGDSMLLSGILQIAAGTTSYQYALENLFEPLGITEVSWESDNAGHTVGGWGINATVRSYAKFGFLYLNYGEWEGRQIVPRSWVEQSLSPVTDNIDFYGFQWWLSPVFQGVQNSIIPEDLFLAWGIYTQQIFVIPSLDLVIVRVANDPDSEEWDEIQFLELIIASINRSAP